MGGLDERSGLLIGYVDLEARVRGDHPLRTIRKIVNAALNDLSEAFTAHYTDFCRPSIAPEKLLRAMLLQAFYGISQATGTTERDKALELIDGRDRRGRITLGADKAYDVTQFVHDLGDRSVTPHIAIDGHLSKTGKPHKTAVDGRTTRHAGYDISQRCRKPIEEVFGWIKSSVGLAKVKLRGRDRVDAAFTLALAAFNLIRLPKLLGGRHVKGKWRIAKMPDYTSDFHDMVEPAYTLLAGTNSSMITRSPFYGRVVRTAKLVKYPPPKKCPLSTEKLRRYRL
jgi:hypothetical protein